MNQKKNQWYCLLVIISLFFIPRLGYADKWGSIIIPAGKPIQIGLGSMLSGDYASMGIDIKNGAEMAVLEKKSILGHPVILQAEDDGCGGPTSVAIAEKMCNNPLVVGVVGYMCSGGSKPASDIHNKYKVLMISPSSTAMELTSRGIPVFFRTCWNDATQARCAADFVIKNNWKKIVVLHDKSDYGQSLAHDFMNHISKNGLKILATEGLTRGDKDFTPILTKIKFMRPELIYFGGMAAEGVLLARQMKRTGIRAYFMSDDGCYTVKDFIQAGGRATNGCYVTYAKKPDAQWVKRFESCYGHCQTFSPQAYDATNILLEAVTQTAKKQTDGSLIIDKKVLRDEVAGIRYKGITGEIAFNSHGDRTGSVVVIYKVVEENGKRFFKQFAH